MDFLAAHSKGLIGLSAGLNGDLSACILKGDFEEAEKALREYAALFGKDNFFIEIMDHGIDGRKALNRRLIELSRSGSIPLATNAVHYLNRENSLAHDVQICIRTEKSLNALRCAGIKTDEKYFNSSQEMQELFSDIPEALLNTLEIAGRCRENLEIYSALLKIITNTFFTKGEKCSEHSRTPGCLRRRSWSQSELMRLQGLTAHREQNGIDCAQSWTESICGDL
ncbi:MAG: PHP domain-containing protein [Candidatus Xenobiia bacterium LiM19]